MAEITAALVKALREISGAGMMDCKRALAENGGDLQNSVDWLRQKGLAAAAKKAGRVAAEGLVGVIVQGGRGAAVEVNTETDFVARNETFQKFVRRVATLALDAGSVEQLLGRPYEGAGATVAERLTELVAKIGENMSVRRMARVSATQGVVASYVHNALAPGLGKIGVLVALESDGNQAKLAAFGKQLAMHVAAANPQAVTVADVDPAALERERAVLAGQARESGKPEAIIAKMIEGRLRKYYEDIVLLEQIYVIDGESRVKQAIESAAKDLGATLRVAEMARLAVGEGIDRAPADAAA